MTYTPYYTQWVNAQYDDAGNVTEASPTPLTAAAATAWDSAIAGLDTSLAGTQASLTEVARDALGAALVSGSGISIVVNDTADTISINNTAAFDVESAQDAVASALLAGAHSSGYGFTYNDAGNAISLVAPSQYSDEAAQDAAAALFTSGSHSGITFVYDDVNNKINATVATGSGAGGSFTAEDAQDAVAALFAAGTHAGISFTYDDANNKLSATVSNVGYTDEQAQDATAALFAAGTHSGVSFTYDDPNNKMNAAVTQRGPVGGVGTLTYAASLTPDASQYTSAGVVATGDLTLNPPTNPVAGQLYLLAVTASGAARTVTCATAIVLTSGTARAYSIASAQHGYLGLRYSSTQTAWVLLSQTQTITG